MYIYIYVVVCMYHSCLVIIMMVVLGALPVTITTRRSASDYLMSVRPVSLFL